MLSSALPLLFASLGALWTELAGALAIFIEGLMGVGAFVAYCVMAHTESQTAACLSAGAVCACIGFLAAFFVNKARANPFVVALAVNMAASGITATLSQAWFGTKGVLRGAAWAFDASPLAAAAALCFLITAFLLYRTRFGLRFRAAGLAPLTARERGVDAARYGEAAWAVAGLLAGIAGACLTLKVGAYTPGGAAGRGWIALAAVYLGFRSVPGVAAAAFLFALVERAGIGLQTVSGLPPTAFLGAPSLAALLFYTLSCLARGHIPRQIMPQKTRRR